MEYLAQPSISIMSVEDLPVSLDVRIGVRYGLHTIRSKGLT